MRTRLWLLLVVVLTTSAAHAQEALGVWAYDLLNDEGQVVQSGFMTVAASGETGSLYLDGPNIDGELIETTLTHDGASFTYTGTFSVGGAGPPFSIEATLDGVALSGQMVLGDNAAALRATRSTPEAYAEATAPPPGAGGDVKDLYEPFDLPTPNRYRSASGRPGPDYWQQEADYRIAVTLDPSTHTASGEVVLTYTNNSPEALDFLWVHLEQNLFTPTSRGATAGSRASGETLDAANGYRLGTITVEGETVEPVVTDTRMRLDLPEAVEASGGTVEVVIPYTFRVPAGEGTPRMGRLEVEAGTIYSMAQWYPRVALYDDVNGWNHLPYLGQGEFYLGFGDFEVAITVPAEMTVVATGELQNESEVFTDAQSQRLAQARGSDAAVMIVPADEVGAPGTRSGMTTWRYRAEDVRDFSWAASQAFILDGARASVQAASGEMDDVLILSAYPTEGIGTPEAPGWEEATRYGKAAIENNSYWFPYPYPVAISVATHIGGMEYPMIHFSGVGRRHFELFGVVDHELGHNWFPMIVGSDEKRHAWMDEGFNTFINGRSNILFYDENEDTSIPGYGESGRSQFVAIVQPDAFANLTQTFGSGDDEILTYADQIDSQEGGWNSYFKPAMGLHILRDYVLGQETFDLAFRTYIERWAFKHPQPADFFRTMEDVSGEDLDWFWRGWFDTIRTYDATITDLTARDGVTRATVSHVGGLVFPAVVKFTFADGTSERATVPVEAFGVDDGVTVRVASGERSVVSARLDPDGRLPDTDRSNDVVNVEN
ncbi:MAG: M1 family metallopeptidase [Bacteroidota bacterium]